MVVLLVGIMSAIRLFPPGFASVRHAESITFASRLAQYEIERWKNNAANLPDGILPIDDGTSGVAEVLNDQYPGPPVDDANSKLLRRVIGETTRIPFGGWSTGPQSGSTYLLSFSPVDIRRDGGGSLINFAVRGGDLSRRIFDSDDTNTRPWEFLRPYQYGIDYGDQGDTPKICFRAISQERTYYISCSWWDMQKGQPELRTVTNVPITVPANTTEWLGPPVSLPTGYIGMDRYSDTVSRGFTELPVSSSWSGDPYEFKIIDGTLGIIEFNPLGYSQREFGRPLEARVDYDILDLQIIHEDKRMPANGPFRVNLTLNHLKQKMFTTETNGTEYKGLYPNILTDDVLAVDLETNRVIDLGGTKGNVSTVSYKDGMVELPARITLLGDYPVQISPAGRNIRFFYKAEGDWSVQFQKAYARYERDYSGGALDYRSYAVESGTPRLWFAACNANNTISVDYEYVEDGETRKVIGESHKATDVLEHLGAVKSTYIDLRNEPSRIFSVTGISARARVVWRDSDRWRYVDLDTTLIRKPES